MNTEPDAGQVAYGTSNIFGTIEQAAASAAGQDGTQEAANANGSDGQTDNSQDGENAEAAEAPADDQGQS